MSQRIVASFGALLTLIGLVFIWRGAEIIEVERGWAQLIAGASVFSAGVVTLAIAALIDAVKTIAVVREAPKTAEAPQISDAPQLADAPTAPFHREPAPSFATPASTDGADEAMIPGEELAPLRAPEPSPAPPIRPRFDSLLRRAPPPPSLAAEIPPEPAPAPTPEPPPLAEEPADPAPEPLEATPRRPRFDFGEAFRRRTSPMVEPAESTPEPDRMDEPTQPLFAEPAPFEPTPTAAPSHAWGEQPLLEPEPTPHPPEPVASEPHETQRPELVVAAEPEPAPIDSHEAPMEPDLAHGEPEPQPEREPEPAYEAQSAHETQPARETRPEPQVEHEPEPEAEPEPDPVTVRGRYSARGVDYVLYSNGAIDAESPEFGLRRFASIQELRAQLPPAQD